MTKREFVIELAKDAELSIKKANEVYNIFMGLLKEKIKKEKHINIQKFGTFKLIKKSAGEARNPRTGEKIKVPERKVVKFKMSKKFKQELQ